MFVQQQQQKVVDVLVNWKQTKKKFSNFMSFISIVEKIMFTKLADN